MKSKELRPVCSLGMFDLLKGISLVEIIVGHTAYCISFEADHPVFSSVFTTVGNLLMYGFIIASGFGIRKRPVKKCALQLKNMFLMPYVYTGLAASILLIFNQFFMFSDIFDALREGLRSILGFALGQHPVQYYGSFQMANVGPLWFMVSLAGGWFIFNLILQFSQGWKRNLLVLLSSLIGHFGNLFASSHGIPIPFCFFYMFVYVLGLYIGYLAKANKWYEKKLSPFMIAIIAISAAAFAWKYNIPYEVSALSNYPLGVFTPFAGAAVGFGITYLMTHINRRETLLTTFLESIGRNSLYIFCVHTVEYIGISWYFFRLVLPFASDAHIFFMVLILRVSFIILGILVIRSFQSWGGVPRLKKILFDKKSA